MTEKECIELFTVSEDASDRGPLCYYEHRFYLDTKTGTPFREIWFFSDITFRPGTVSPGSRHDITYESLLMCAKRHAPEVYARLEGINEDHWADYVIGLI